MFLGEWQLPEYLYLLSDNQTFDIICPLLRGHNGALLHAVTQVLHPDPQRAGTQDSERLNQAWCAIGEHRHGQTAQMPPAVFPG